MPIFMDRHFVQGATHHALALAHEKDIALQDQFNVKFLTYWFDEERHTTFCLVDAPNKQAIIDAHHEAHGDVPHEIIEVDPAIVEAFLGRVRDPSPVDTDTSTSIDSAFRGIMFTDLQNSTLMTTIHGDSKSLHLLHIHNALTRNSLRKYGGREIKHTGDGFMVSFTSIEKMVQCAIEIQQSFAEHNSKSTTELNVSIGLSAGEPIEEHGDLFGTSVQLAARLCAHAKPTEIQVSEEVFAQCHQCNIRFNEMEPLTPKGFDKPVRVFSVLWQR